MKLKLNQDFVFGKLIHIRQIKIQGRAMFYIPNAGFLTNLFK